MEEEQKMAGFGEAEWESKEERIQDSEKNVPELADTRAKSLTRH